MATKLFDTDNVRVDSTPQDHQNRPGHKEKDWFSGNGYDLNVRPGTKVYSLTDGKVISNNWSPATPNVYGNRVQIDTGNDTLYYTHIRSNVKVGQDIKKGDLIGTVERWGENPAGSHLHIASKNRDVGNYVDFKTWSIVGASQSPSGDKTPEKGEEPETPTSTSKPKTALDAFSDAYFNKVTYPMIFAALPGLAKESRLMEQINRIKNLM